MPLLEYKEYPIIPVDTEWIEDLIALISNPTDRRNNITIEPWDKVRLVGVRVISVTDKTSGTPVERLRPGVFVEFAKNAPRETRKRDAQYPLKPYTYRTWGVTTVSGPESPLAPLSDELFDHVASLCAKSVFGYDPEQDYLSYEQLEKEMQK